MPHATLARTTRTVELSQLAELNVRLLDPSRDAEVTAAQLGLEGSKVSSGPEVGGLPDSAVLHRVCWDGPPEWPYIHGHFALGRGGLDSLVVDLHTDALVALSHRLHVRQLWGV